LAKALRRSRDWTPRAINTDKTAGGRPWKAEAPDQTDARLPVDEDGLCDDQGFEVMRMFKKGQFTAWIDAIGGGTEAHFINRLFGLYA
jgi:hypothetical protein